MEVPPAERFRVFLSNFSKSPRRLPKGTVVGYANRNPISIVTPDRDVAEECGKVLNLTTLPTSSSPEFEIENPTWDDPCANFQVGGSLEPVLHTQEETPGRRESLSPGSAGPSATWQESVNLDHIPDDELRTKIMAMLAKHSDMWDGSLGEIHATKHRLPLVEGARPHREMPRRTGPENRRRIAEELQKMLHAGVIGPATSEWASQVVLVGRKDGSLRFCADYRRLNMKTLTDAYPLPRMADCINSLGDARVFSTLEGNSVYWQIPVDHGDQDKTTFTTHCGSYRYKRMPFGLKNAPATFQRALDIILSGVRRQICLVYLDDVIVFSKDQETHLDHLDTVLSLLRNEGVSLKLKKCFFFRPKVDYLGHVILPGKLSVARARSAAFEKCRFPQTLTQPRSFLGACNVYRSFIAGFAKVARPPSAMLCKDADIHFAAPTAEQTDAFEELRRRVASPPIKVMRHGVPRWDRRIGQKLTRLNPKLVAPCFNDKRTIPGYRWGSGRRLAILRNKTTVQPSASASLSSGACVPWVPTWREPGSRFGRTMMPYVGS